MKKIFNITNKYIVIATPLILFSLLSTIYLMVSSGGRLISLLFALFLFVLMTGAFVAGWFNMIKLAVINPESNEPNSLIKEFPAGVGEYFLSSLGALFVVFVFSSIIIAISWVIGMHFIGDIGITADAFSKAMQNQETLKAFLMSLSIEQLTKINLWNVLLLTTLSVAYFLMILYIPALFFKSKNPLKAFLISLKDLFSRKFFITLGIFSLIFAANFTISILTALFTGIAIVHFILTLVNFYFLCFVGIGVFYYYNENFVKPQIGRNIDTRI